MCCAKSRTIALAARLTALTGSDVLTEELEHGVRVTARMPERLGEGSRKALIATLADADRYGHDVVAEGATVWGEIDVPGLSDGRRQA